MVHFCSAAEVIPPPKDHFTDYAHVVSPATAGQLNKQLEEFERQTSNQILVAIFPKMQTDSSIEDYTVRIFEKWKPGLKNLSNGAILFVFVQDRKMFINTGYGLEGALPDAICKQIIDQEITPQFKQNNYDAGLRAGVNAMLAAARGEYKGTGRTVRDTQRGTGNPVGQVMKPVGGLCSSLFPILIILFLIFRARSTTYGRRGRRGGWFFWPGYYGGFGGYGSYGNWGGGGWSSGGGSWGGGGGTFSSGGGSTGGGGAGGSW